MDDSNKSFQKMKERIEALRKSVANSSEDIPFSIQMETDLYYFSPEEQTLTLSFPVLKKELNPNGAMIGGIMCTAIDITYGILIYGLTSNNIITPTITMTTNFINPIFYGDTLLVTAKIESWGKRIINMTAEGKSLSNGNTIVTSTASFISDKSFEKK